MIIPARLPLPAALVLALLPTAAGAQPTVTGPTRAPGPAVGTVSIDQGQAGFIISAGYGGGVLSFRGKTYRFEIGGLGIGAIGASAVQATGTVHNMTSVAQFPGAYAAFRAGAVIGNRSIGRMWLRNENGVVMNLNAKREGLMLATGGDAVLIKMKK
jgi:hypothetical protein